MFFISEKHRYREMNVGYNSLEFCVLFHRLLFRMVKTIFLSAASLQTDFFHFAAICGFNNFRLAGAATQECSEGTV